MVEDVRESFLKESVSPADVGPKQQEVQRFERVQLSLSTVTEDRALKGQMKQPEGAEEVSRWCSEDHPENQSEVMKPTQSESDSEGQLSLPSLTSSGFLDSFQDKGHSSISSSLKKAEPPSKHTKPSAELASSEKDVFPVWDKSPPNKEGKKKSQEPLIKQKQPTESFGTAHHRGNKEETVLKQDVVAELEEVSTQKSKMMPTFHISPSSCEEIVALKEPTPPAAQTDKSPEDTSLLFLREVPASTKNLPSGELILPKKLSPKGKSASTETSQTVPLKTPGPSDTLSSPAQEDLRFPQMFLSEGVPAETKAPDEERKKRDQATQVHQQRPVKGTLVCLNRTDSGSPSSHFLY